MIHALELYVCLLTYLYIKVRKGEFMKYSINIFKQNININDIKHLLKLLLIAISMPLGICFSLYLAYHNINFLELIDTINDNLGNYELLDHISNIFKPWYTVSIKISLVGLMV